MEGYEEEKEKEEKIVESSSIRKTEVIRLMSAHSTFSSLLFLLFLLFLESVYVFDDMTPHRYAMRRYMDMILKLTAHVSPRQLFIIDEPLPVGFGRKAGRFLSLYLPSSFHLEWLQSYAQ
jgi:hypothetical protein